MKLSCYYIVLINKKHGLFYIWLSLCLYCFTGPLYSVVEQTVKRSVTQGKFFIAKPNTEWMGLNMN